MQQLFLSREEATSLKTFNYRSTTEEDLKKLAFDMASLGQQTPVLLARMHGEAAKAYLLQEGETVLVAGWRRLQAFLMMPKLKIKNAPDTLRCEICDIAEAKDFRTRQLSENLNRVGSTYTENGQAFAVLLNNGMSIKELIPLLTFPAGYISEKQKTEYIQARVTAVTDLDESLFTALDEGLILEDAKQGSQVSIIARYPKVLHQKLAKAYQEMPIPMTHVKLAGFFFGHGMTFPDKGFDLEDQTLGLQSENTGACFGCPWMLDAPNYAGKTIKKCFLQSCFEHKIATSLARAKEQAAQEFGDQYAYAGDKHWTSGKMIEEKDGRNVYHGWMSVGEGSCVHTIPVINANPELGSSLFYICPKSSHCPHHWPEKAKTEAKVEGKISNERFDVKYKAIGEFQNEVLKRWVKAYRDGELESNEQLSTLHTETVEKMFLKIACEKILNWVNSNEKDFIRSQMNGKLDNYDDPVELACLQVLLTVTESYKAKSLLSDFMLACGKDYQEEQEVFVDKIMQEYEAKWSKRLDKFSEEQSREKERALTMKYILPILYPGLDYDNEDALASHLADDAFRQDVARKLSIPNWNSIKTNERLAAGAIRGRINELGNILPAEEAAGSAEAKLYKLFKNAPAIHPKLPDTPFGHVIGKAISIAKGRNDLLAVAELYETALRPAANDFTLILAHKNTVRILKEAAQYHKMNLAQSGKEFQVVPQKSLQ